MRANARSLKSDVRRVQKMINVTQVRVPLGCRARIPIINKSFLSKVSYEGSVTRQLL